MRLVFVCTANMCRSPLAESLCRHAVAARGLDGIEVASAGVFASEGRAASAGAARVASSRGLDLSEHRSRPFLPDSIGGGDLVLVMEEMHRRQILAQWKLDPGTVRLLGSFAPDGPREIDDPIGGPDIAYEQCAKRLERCLEGLLDHLGRRGIGA